MRWAAPAFCCLGILFGLTLYRGAAEHSGGANDFLAFYAGGKLAGTGHLYDPEAVYRIHRSVIGYSAPGLLFIRPAFEAALFWPVSHLPYPQAYAIYQISMALAVLLFVRVWPFGNWVHTLLACCWSFPLFASFAIGQDAPFVLLAVGISIERLHRGKDLQAGLVFALCAMKPHLFMLVIVWILARRMWAFAKGLTVGGLVLLAVSFLAGGMGWIPALLHVWQRPDIHPALDTMPNLYGLFEGNAPLTIAGAMIVGMAVWLASRRGTAEYGLTAAIAAGLLVARHTHVADCLLLLPCLLVVGCRGELWQKWFAYSLMAPVVYFGTGIPGVLALVTRLALIGFVLSLGIPSLNRTTARRRLALETAAGRL